MEVFYFVEFIMGEVKGFLEISRRTVSWYVEQPDKLGRSPLTSRNTKLIHDVYIPMAP